MRMGVLGGTFDPIHVGHLSLAEVAIEEVGLDEVIFVPAGNPYFKPPAQVSPTYHRLSMVCLGLMGHPRFRLSTIELDRPGPSYTADTLSELRRKWGNETEIYFLMGWDNLQALPSWHDPQEIMACSRLVVAPRVGYPVTSLAQLEKKLPGLSEKVIWLREPIIEVSATMVRERVMRGLPIDGLVPPAVASYIEREGLYR